MKKENEFILKILIAVIKKKYDNLKYHPDFIKSLDYSYISNILKKHRITPLFYHVIELNHDLIQFPLEFRELLQKMHISTLNKNLKFIGELKSIVKNYNKENIEIIPLKGIFLIEKVYDNISERLMNDIDLLVKEEKIDKAEQIAISLGYSSKEKIEFQKIMKEKHCHIAPLFKDGVCIEIHRHLIRDSDQFKIDHNKIWEKASTMNIDDICVHTLSLEDMILHLAVHLTRNYGGKRVQLISLVDIYKIIEKNKDVLSWKTLINRAHEFKLEKYLYISLKLTEKFLDIRYPEIINNLEPLCPRRQIIWFNSEFCEEDVLNFNYDFMDELLWTESLKSKWIVFKERTFLHKESIHKRYSFKKENSSTFYLYIFRFFDLLKKQIKLMLNIKKMKG